MQKYKIARIILLFAVSVQMLSCSKTAGDDPAGMDASLALSLLTRNGNGDLALTGEDEFTSLAVYIFNHDNGDLEFSELVTGFTPESAANSYVRSVRVTKDKKAIYAVANYAGKNFTANGQAVTIDENTPKSTLDALEIVSSSFSADDIAMIGKTATTMSGTAVNASVEMERLVGRVDMHVFKSAELTDDLVELTSIEFRNQVVRSNVQYQSKAMPGGDIRRTETYTSAAAGYLDVVPDDADYAALKPSDAEKSFYSYQNISGEEDPSGAAPDDASTPYLLVNVKVNGAPVTYRGDLKNTAGFYDLERNRIYRVKAVVGAPNDLLFLRVDVLKWDTELSSITYDELAFAFSGVDYGANYGQVSQSAPATYDFKLAAPDGAVWAANLTNGHDFKLLSEGGYVSQGITRADSYSVRIVPAKSFTPNVERETQFYISIDGKKAKINPDNAGGSFAEGRKYPGTETDILIKQIQ